MATELTEEPVGKGNPPKASQYRKGQCGNRKGRPKGRNNMKTIVERVAFKEHDVNGRKLTTIGYVLQWLQRRSLDDSLEATTYLETLREKYQPEEPEATVSGIILPPVATMEEFEKECKAARARLRWVQANRETLWEEMGLTTGSPNPDNQRLDPP